MNIGIVAWSLLKHVGGLERFCSDLAAELLSRGHIVTLLCGKADRSKSPVVHPIPEGSAPEQIYQFFNNRLNKPKNDNSMNLEDLRKRPRFKDCATDDDALRILGQMETDAGKVPNLTADVTRLTGELKVYKEREEAEATAAKKKLLDDAIADGRINETQRPVYQALLDKDRENGEAALKSLTAKKRIVASLEQPNNPALGAWEKRQHEISNKLKK